MMPENKIKILDGHNRSSKTSIKSRVKRHFWVPPPALTSAACSGKSSKCPQRRTRITKPETIPIIEDRLVKKKSFVPRKPTEEVATNFNNQLEALLDEIKRVKSSDIVSEAIEPDEQSKRDDIPSASGEQIHEGIERLTTKERFLLQKSVGLIKDEVLESVSKSATLSNRHAMFVEKLKQIEEDAGDAVKHVASLRNFIQQLDQKRDGDSSSQPEKLKNVLVKLSRLDDANRSLQNLISGFVTNDEQEAMHQNYDEFRRYRSVIKNLEDRLKTEQREIVSLKTEFKEAVACSNAEKQSLKKEISSHRERANRYLSDFDTVNTLLNEKKEAFRTLKKDLKNQKLFSTQLSSDNARLKFENETLKSKLDSIEIQLRTNDSIVRTKMNEMELNFHKVSSKATILELENNKLQLTLTGTEARVSRQKSEIERLEKELENSLKLIPHFTREIPSKKTKSIQVDLDGVDSQQNKADGDHAIVDENKWIKVKELCQIVQKEKDVILKQLKDLEMKFELSEESNQAFRKELIKKEEIISKNSSMLQEKIIESNYLKESLQTALNEMKKFGDEGSRMQTLDRNMQTQTKLEELERLLLQYRSECDQLRKQRNQLERKWTTEIEGLHRQLESLRNSNTTLQEYVNFLRTSYANVFGEST